MQIVALVSSFAFELFAHVLNNLFILRMYRHDATVLGDFNKNAPQMSPRNTNRVVDSEDLEAGNALLDCLTDLANGFRADLSCNDVVKGIVNITVHVKNLTTAFERFKHGTAGPAFESRTA